ncbi:MAG: uroporphyrinogen decarboxylase family protein, partial [Patescibacteria group bacterium]
MRQAMSGRERVLAAVGHQETDRVPLDLQATPEAWARLAAHFGTDDTESILQGLGVDLRYIMPVNRMPSRRYGDGSYDGPWGNRLRRVANPTGAYEEVAFYPLDGAMTPEEIEAFEFPDPGIWQDYSEVAAACRKNGNNALVGGYASVFYIPTQLRSMERILLDMAAAPAMVHALVNKALRYAIAYNEPLLAAGGGRIDFLHIADDYATQRGLLMSLAMWREFFREPTRRLVEMA